MFSLENNFHLNPKSLSELLYLQANRPQLPPHISTFILQNRMLSYLAKRPQDQCIPTDFLPSTKKTKTEKVEVLISNPELKERQLENLIAPISPVQRLESSSSIKAGTITHSSPVQTKPSCKKNSSIVVKTEHKSEMVQSKRVDPDTKIEEVEKEKPKKDAVKGPKVTKQEEEREIYELTERYNAFIAELRSSGKAKKKDIKKNKKKSRKLEEDELDDEFSTIGTENSKDLE